jgi:TolB protein
MARRAAELDTPRMLVREDPLRAQNRALSLVTVGLLASLIGMVLWFTSQPRTSTNVVSQLPTPIPSPTRPSAATLPPTITPTPTPIPDPLRTGGSIVYVQRERGVDNLWAVEIGQPSPIRLTNQPFDDRDPVWSRDGKRIAFASNREGNWDLYVMEVATLRIARLTYTPSYERHPTWSPDDAFIAYEAYEGNNLDIWIVGATGRPEPIRLTEHPAPDFNPTWSPGGREVAYLSLREGNPEIYISNLDRPGNPRDANAVRFTNTPDLEEESVAWSPDNRYLTYSGRSPQGLQLVYLKLIGQPTSEPSVLGPGREPAWSPASNAVIAAVDAGANTTLLSYQVGAVGIAATTLSVPYRTYAPDWTRSALPISLKSTPPPIDPVANLLYTEEIGYRSQQPPYRRLRDLSGGKAPPHSLYLTDSVDDSFAALREATRAKIGLDFLGERVEMLWKISGADRYVPDPGQSSQNFHYAGRAFDFDRNLVFSSSSEIPSPIEVVREDDPNGSTYWRVYVRVAEPFQNGSLGEPLRRLPWDIASRSSTDPTVVEQGGKPKATVPPGYYMDFTALAETYGWSRVAALRNWRAFAGGLLYWQFERRDGLSWNDAMLELYSQLEVDAYLAGPAPRPVTAAPTDTPRPPRTATPIPPDRRP